MKDYGYLLFLVGNVPQLRPVQAQTNYLLNPLVDGLEDGSFGSSKRISPGLLSGSYRHCDQGSIELRKSYAHGDVHRVQPLQGVLPILLRVISQDRLNDGHAELL